LYRECLVFELRERGLTVATEDLIPIFYKGRSLNGHYRIDLLVEDAVLVELKSIESVLPVHCAQVLTYLRLTDKRVGLLINFNLSYLRQGVRCIVNAF
jgi:GxxExxY protein